MTGVILDRESFDRGDLDLRPLRCAEPHWTDYAETAPRQVIDRLAGAEVAVTNKAPIDAHALQALPKLRLIAVAATGTNNIDLKAARNRGVTVCNVRGYATHSVVQHVFGLMLSLSRSLPAYTDSVQRGEWQRSRQFCLLDWPISELTGQTLGIVGYGELGRAVSRVAESAFGMKVLVAERPGRAPRAGRVTLEHMLSNSDVVTLHCPLTTETEGLIGERELHGMKPGALLINTARGGIIDETALAEALRAGIIGGAGVDVLSTEPPVGGNPLLAEALPNLIVTPHVAWASREARQRMVNQLAENIRAFTEGRPRNVVTS